MFFKRLGLVSLAIGVGLGVAGCTDGYGYGGGGIGYASDPYYGGGYGNGYYDGYGGGYGAGYAGVGLGSYYGWYGDYYYPGTGGYVYDRNRRPHRWNGAQQRYWQGRRGNYRGAGNWGNFARGNSPAARDYRQDRRGANRDFRQGRREDRNQLRDDDGDAGRAYRRASPGESRIARDR
ncbi:MAG: hypothetical protein EOP67_30990 [Sphingomonas sp.]|nr:MAG: hypothetical protein EOP67_30990 [Sphingomonas sp.]